MSTMATHPDGTRKENYSSLELYEEMEGGNRAAKECHIDLEGAVGRRQAREQWIGRFRMAGYVALGFLVILPLLVHRSNGGDGSDPAFSSFDNSTHPAAHIVIHQHNSRNGNASNHNNNHNRNPIDHNPNTRPGYHYGGNTDQHTSNNSSSSSSNSTNSTGHDSFPSNDKTHEVPTDCSNSTIHLDLGNRWRDAWTSLNFDLGSFFGGNMSSKQLEDVNIALSGDGHTLVISDVLSPSLLNLSEVGMIAVYRWNETQATWIVDAQVMGTQPHVRFGAGLAVSRDGSVVAVSSGGVAKNSYNVRLYQWNGMGDVQESILRGGHGTPAGGPAVMSLSDDGSHIGLATPHLNVKSQRSALQIFSTSNSTHKWSQEGIYPHDKPFWMTSLSGNGTKMVAVSRQQHMCHVDVWVPETKGWKSIHGLDLLQDGKDCMHATGKLSSDGNTLVTTALMMMPPSTSILRIARYHYNATMNAWDSLWTRDMVQENVSHSSQFPMDVAGDGKSMSLGFGHQIMMIKWTNDGGAQVNEYALDDMQATSMALSHDGCRLGLVLQEMATNASHVEIFSCADHGNRRLETG